MLSTGVVLIDRDPIIGALVTEAGEVMKKAVPVSEQDDEALVGVDDLDHRIEQGAEAPMPDGEEGARPQAEAGWLVLTHGGGAMRCYAIGALLLDLDHPQRIIGQLAEPLLAPTAKRACRPASPSTATRARNATCTWNSRYWPTLAW